ncbi:uncharacterized protein LOC106156243 [Lingula anatina]|uniref:Uncharacterized protein LOC106156243 n=1 Tax=Lingula anatina TaxID=7574 RepID=A0A1S3HMX5_LINAN|nr:uncharacterized protein LOC106156243 [Lingula anatina]|eukprot:XP_013386861.1 uncharacterized protein LOC106156243 [Lingula anatina]
MKGILVLLLIIIGLFRHSGAQIQVTECGDLPVVSVSEATPAGTVLLNFTTSTSGVTDIVIEDLEPADEFVSLNISRRALVLKHAIDAENMTALSYKFTLRCRFKVGGIERQGVNFFIN